MVLTGSDVVTISVTAPVIAIRQLLWFPFHRLFNDGSLTAEEGARKLRNLETSMITSKYYSKKSRPATGPIHPPIKFVAGALSKGGKQPGHEADHSLPSSAEFNNTWSYTSTPQYVSRAWCFVKHGMSSWRGT